MQLEMKNYPVHLTEPWIVDSDVESYGAAEDLNEAYQIRVANRPYAQSVRELYRLKNQELPPKLDTLIGEPYIIVHAVGVIANKKPQRIRRIGLDATVEEGRAFIVELFPNTQFKEYFTGEVDASFQAGVGADGHAKLPATDLAPIDPVALGAGAEVQLSTNVSVVGNLNLKMGIRSPKIQTIGQASSRATWQIDRNETDLVGDQPLVQTVVAKHGAKQLTYQINGFLVVDRWMRSPVRLEAPPVVATVDL